MSFVPYLRTEAMVVFRWQDPLEGPLGLLLQKDGTFQTVDGYGDPHGEPMTLEEARAFKASVPRERWYRERRVLL
jgi:hypothetical protein